MSEQPEERKEDVSPEVIPKADEGEGADGEGALRLSHVESEGDKPKATLDPSPLLEVQHLSSHPADELHPPDSPTTSLITSLRTQLSLLSEQAHQLNSKLISSISKHSDLEDAHFVLQHHRDSLLDENKELHKVKDQWEDSMNTGLYVERSQIKDEMQRLAAGLVEEERRRGSAEERRQKVEEDIDELAASLFGQANTMVAQERLGRIEAETRLKSTEENLIAAEAAVRDMQLHLQSLPTTAAPVTSPPPTGTTTVSRRYLSSHSPYAEYLTFLKHLRSLRPLKETSKATFPPPLIANLLTQPFLARALAEDHDPALRLDAAPGLSFFSRRSISAAIVAGDLIIEPVSASSVLASSTTSAAEVSCSLCGLPIFPASLVPPQSPATSHFGPPPAHPTQRNSSSTRFSIKPFFTSPTPAASHSPAQSPAASPHPTPSSLSAINTGAAPSLPPVYIFRIAKSNTTAVTPGEKEKEKENKSYPLCRTGWCLERLRAACELWRFVRTGIVGVVWIGDDGYVLPSEGSRVVESIDDKGEAGLSSTVSGGLEVAGAGSEGDRPPLPPRKKSKSGWGLGFKLADKGGSSWTKGWAISTSGSGSGSGPGTGHASAGGSVPASPLADRDRDKRSSTGTNPGSIGAEKSKDDEVLHPVDLDVEPVSGISPTHDGHGHVLPISGLGAPLELKTDSRDPAEAVAVAEADANEKVVIDSSVPTIQEIHPTPTNTHPTDTPVPPDADADADADLKRAESAISVGSTNEHSEQFATPVSEHEELHSHSHSAAAAETPKQVELASPPPIPRRAAARDRASALLSTSASASGVVTPIEDPPSESKKGVEEEEVDEAAILREAMSDLAEAQKEAEQREAVAVATTAEEAEKAEQPQSEARSEETAVAVAVPTEIEKPPASHAPAPAAVAVQTKAIAPPPLPARHPRTPKQGETPVVASAKPTQDKTYLPTEEDWEARTWKKVIELKEDMWRTRVGVVID